MCHGLVGVHIGMLDQHPALAGNFEPEGSALFLAVYDRFDVALVVDLEVQIPQAFSSLYIYGSLLDRSWAATSSAICIGARFWTLL